MIEDDWRNLKAENERKKKEDREKDMQRNIKAQEAVGKQKELEEKRKNDLFKKIKSDSLSASAFKNIGTTYVHNCEMNHKPEPMKNLTSEFKHKRILHSLAVEFGLHYIRVGWINPETKRFEVLKNQHGDIASPTILGISKDDEILFGSEILQRPFEEVKHKFPLRSILVEHRNPATTFGYNIRGKGDARKELLMGHMLRRVKEDVENQLEGTWETAVITVPLWYSSVHRQATRDAATIAGFKDIYLVNETSAAAMANIDYTAKSDGSEMIMVGVYNESYYDIALYSVFGKQIQMLTSGGNNHSPHNLKRQEISPVLLLGDTLQKASKKLFEGVVGVRDESDLEKCVKTVVGENRECIRTVVLVNTNPTVHLGYSKEIGALLHFQFRNNNAPTVRELKNNLSIIQGAVEIASILQEHSATGYEQKKKILMNMIQDRLTYGVGVIYDQGSNYPLFEFKSKLTSPKGGNLTQQITLKRSHGRQNKINLH